MIGTVHACDGRSHVARIFDAMRVVPANALVWVGVHHLSTRIRSARRHIRTVGDIEIIQATDEGVFARLSRVAIDPVISGAPQVKRRLDQCRHKLVEYERLVLFQEELTDAAHIHVVRTSHMIVCVALVRIEGRIRVTSGVEPQGGVT